METGELFMTTVVVTVTEIISMKVLKEETNMTVIIVNVVVIMIGLIIHHSFLLFSD
jgi:glucose uptake protein GlcU